MWIKFIGDPGKFFSYALAQSLYKIPKFNFPCLHGQVEWDLLMADIHANYHSSLHVYDKHLTGIDL